MRWSIKLPTRTKTHLKGLCRGSTPARIMIRARSLLMLAEGKGVGQVAEIVGCSGATVKRVRRRFLDEGWKRAVYDAPKPGRPRAVTIREETKDFLEAIRQHWSIENRLHWVLDMAF